VCLYYCTLVGIRLCSSISGFPGRGEDLEQFSEELPFAHTFEAHARKIVMLETKAENPSCSVRVPDMSTPVDLRAIPKFCTWGTQLCCISPDDTPLHCRIRDA
jgi:hypothetical protein